MVIGTATRCSECGVAMTSCVMPAECHRCSLQRRAKSGDRVAQQMLDADRADERRRETEMAEHRARESERRRRLETVASYQDLASRTECDQNRARLRFQGAGETNLLAPVRLMHAVSGLASEAGEAVRPVLNWLYYGRPLDAGKLMEELGDCLWFVSQACNVLGVRMEDLMEANIAKLRERFPDKYSDQRHQQRDEAKEKNVSNLAPVGRSTGERFLAVGVDPAEPGDDRTSVCRVDQKGVRPIVLSDPDRPRFEEGAAFVGPNDPREACPKCSGTGRTWVEDKDGSQSGYHGPPCKECDGSGEKPRPALRVEPPDPCPRCEGTGRIKGPRPVSNPVCPACNGSGYYGLAPKVYAGGTVTGYANLPDRALQIELTRQRITKLSREERTYSEVEWLRRHNAIYGGCCNRFADNQGCDCLHVCRPDPKHELTPTAKTSRTPDDLGKVLSEASEQYKRSKTSPLDQVDLYDQYLEDRPDPTPPNQVDATKTVGKLADAMDEMGADRG